MRLHTLAATVAVVLGSLLRLPRRDFISVLTAIMVVMVAEMVNTAVESVVDIASPAYHPLAKVAKDVAAGAVLFAAGGALALGIWVFGPRLRRLPQAIVAGWRHEPWELGLMALVVALVGLTVALAPAGSREEDHLD